MSWYLVKHRSNFTFTFTLHFYVSVLKYMTVRFNLRQRYLQICFLEPLLILLY
jgi:hypothetical protein